MQPSVSADRAVEVQVAGGDTVVLRPLRPTDEPAMRRFLEDELSAASRYRRFFTPMPVIHARVVRDLVAVDQSEHWAWGAFLDDRCLAEVRAVRLSSDPSAAEIAFSVSDSVQRRGLGTLLVEVIGVVARSAGVGSFVAEVQPDNAASSHLLTRLGMRFRFSDGVAVGRGPVPPWTGPTDVARSIVALQVDAVATSALAA